MSRVSKCQKCYWAHIETWADPEDCDEHPCSKGMQQTRYGYEYKHGLCSLFKPGKNPQVIENDEKEHAQACVALGVISTFVIAPVLLRWLGLISWSREACFAPLLGISCIVLFMGSIVLMCEWLNPAVEDDA